MAFGKAETAARAVARPRIFRGWWIALAGFLGYFVDTGVGGHGLSALLRPMAAALDTSITNVVFGLTIAAVVSAVASLFVGPIVDRYGARVMMTYGAVVIGLLVLLVSRIENLWQFYLLFGLGIGLTRPFLSQVAPTAAVANWFVRKRAEAFAFMSIGSPLSGVILTPIIGVIIALYGWREAWVFSGLLPLLLVAPIAWIFVRRRPEDVGLMADGEPLEIHRKVGPPPEVVWTRREVLGTATFWLLLVGQLLISAPSSSIMVHIVSIAEDSGFDPTLATTVMSIFSGGAIGGRFFWAYVITHTSIRWSLVIQAFVYGVAIAMVVAVSLLTPTHYLLYPAVAILGVATGGTIQLRSQALADYFGRAVTGSVTGYVLVGQTATVAGGPLFMGLVRDTTGTYVPGLVVFSVICLIAGFVYIAARPPIPPRRPGEAAP